MALKQLSVFVENKPGRLLEAVKELADANINLRASSIADTTDFGILRLIVSDITKAKEILSQELLVTVTDVVAVEMKDEAGSLFNILTALSDANINIEYMYAFTASRGSRAYVVFRVDDNDAAENALSAKGIKPLSNDDIFFTS